MNSTAPLESTTMFMFVLIGNAVTMAILGKALWPEGGEGGGQIVAQGDPREVAQVLESWTGRFLRQHFEAREG